MAKKWKEILADKSAFPDDFAIALKDGQTMTLGDMRAYDVEHEGELTRNLTAKEQDIQKRERQVNDASLVIGTVVEKVAAASGLSVDELLSGKAPTRRQVAAATELDENAPLNGALVKQIKAMQARLDSQDVEIKKTRTDALGPMLNTYLEDYYEGTWEKIEPTLPKGSDVKRDAALKYAQENGYKDAKGRLDLRKAAKDLTYDARVKAEAAIMAADLRKKDDDTRVLAAAPRPSGTHINVKTDKSLLNQKGQTKSIDEVLSDAAADTDLWRSIQSVQ